MTLCSQTAVARPNPADWGPDDRALMATERGLNWRSIASLGRWASAADGLRRDVEVTAGVAGRARVADEHAATLETVAARSAVIGRDEATIIG